MVYVFYPLVFYFIQTLNNFSQLAILKSFHFNLMSNLLKLYIDQYQAEDIMDMH